MSVEFVLDSAKGSVVAPAGCGKTHLIADIVQTASTKPFLVLTHTTAGVAALKKRLRTRGVSNKNVHVTTIDGWSLLIAKKFPATCSVKADPEHPKIFYPDLRKTVCSYLQAGHLGEILAASYSRLLVDEYQDCNDKQHEMIAELSQVLPTTVFGDPLQSVFDFAGPIPSWGTEVQREFPHLLTLNKPWRWENAGTAALGEWILGVRLELLAGRQIDLRSCPAHVSWYQLSGNTQGDDQATVQIQYGLRKQIATHENLLIIGDSMRPQSRHKFARSVIGVDVVEPVELAEIVSAAKVFDNCRREALVELVLTIAGTMMTSIGKNEILKRIETILQGRNRTEPTHAEVAAIEVLSSGSRKSILDLFEALEQFPGAKIYRKSALNAMKAAILKAVQSPEKSFLEAARNVREKRRHFGDSRVLSRAIGSTLLLKGLEADHVFILDATPMNAKHLYVALSRGAKSITVCSQNPICP